MITKLALFGKLDRVLRLQVPVVGAVQGRRPVCADVAANSLSAAGVILRDARTSEHRRTKTPGKM